MIAFTFGLSWARASIVIGLPVLTIRITGASAGAAAGVWSIAWVLLCTVCIPRL
jgi:hypothetical protein